MDLQKLSWISLIVIFLANTFGIFGLFVTLASLLLFLAGAFSLLYLKLGNVDKFHTKCIGNPLTTAPQTDGGLKCIEAQLSSPKKLLKSDSRVTGSELIDSSLQEILGYIIRDYIEPWYRLVSIDNEFLNTSVRDTAQSFAVNISNRVKEVDWIPFLTQRLVDDAATHLRLYKQARAKIKLQEKSKESKNTTSKISPKKNAHKRNKSETDVSWYVCKNTEFRKDVGNSKFYTNAEPKNSTLEEYFFELELQLEKNLVSRELVCTNVNKEKEFLTEFLEILLYVLLPDEDFQCKPLRFLLRDIFSNGVVLPLINLITDPDFINQAVISTLLKNSQIPSDVFLTTLRLTESQDELKSTKNLVETEIHHLRSRDCGGEDLNIKQQLSSLAYVIKLIDSRLSKMENHANSNKGSMESLPMDKESGIDLTLEQILKDNLGLSYFMDFVSSQGRQMDLYFYLNIECWKNSISKELHDAKPENLATVHEMVRSTALGIYEQHLGYPARNENRVQLDENLTQNLYFRIRNLNETPSERWFDPISNALFEKMERDWLESFKQSRIYVKLLHELDLIPQNPPEEDSLSLEEVYAPSEVKNGQFLTVEAANRSVKHARSFSDVTVFKNDVNIAKEAAEGENIEDLKTGSYDLGVNIIETGIVCEKGKTFGIYAIRVSRQYSTGYLEEWHIYRRYSDFYDLHTKIKEKYLDLSKLPFPGKKTFHNMDRAVLERRMKMLGQYMSDLCQMKVIESHAGLKELLMTFLEQGDYDRATGGPISTTINAVVNPLKSGMKTIKNMPEQLINTMDEMVTKVFHSGRGASGKIPETSKVGASIEENDDNIPLRIMLLLMDEVFELKSRNQWLRRRIVTILRQIVRTMFGDIVNRRILDYVSYVTSPKNMAHYLHLFKQSFWPNGVRNDRKTSERCPDTKNRTKIAAKAALLSSLSDELKHIIGSETTRRGLLNVFDLFQRPVLNRRLFYVLLEGVVCTLFPDKDLAGLIQKLYKSNDSQKESGR
ncbi:sorting nexin-13-like [Anthonomus grandis grandis]|uniref:sorting nexin-13-like n=1 Tax=Anthonomus grandis grandis TaxID=2921223 RepID=UPI002166273B|nr:sorting nexin-13-like [Anthonomus grandis grandis]